MMLHHLVDERADPIDADHRRPHKTAVQIEAEI